MENGEQTYNYTKQFDLNRIDFDWVEKCVDKKELHKAYLTLKEDGGYKDLEKAVVNKLKELDPAFKRKIEGEFISPEEERNIAQDIATFLSDIQYTDQQLSKSGKSKDDDKAIFTTSSSSNSESKKNSFAFAEEVEKKKMAEYERLKGNECMHSKDFQEAIQCYSKSLELYPDDPATYSNRAMAYLSLKEYSRVIDDSNAAIKLKSDYIKAYHRRGKAYTALNKIELAIRDFQYILEQEPHNKEAMKELKNARSKLDSKLQSTVSQQQPAGAAEQPNAQPKITQQQQQKQNKFVRVAIQEESDEEEEEEATKVEQENVIIQESVQDVKKEEPIKKEEPKKQGGIEELKSQENENWWKSSDMKYEDFKVKKQAEEDEQKKQENSQQFHRMKIEEDDDEDIEKDKLKKEEEEKLKKEKEAQEKLKKAQEQEKLQQNAETKEREAEKKKYDELLVKVEKIKDEASVQFDKSMYEEAVKIFQKAADLIEGQLKSYNFYRKNLIEKEATIFNNIAACYKQTQHNKLEAEFSTKVIDRAPFISDLNVLAKAYQRRGYAYEQLEKYAEAKDDMTRVKEIQPSNSQASQALTRLSKALKDLQRVDLSDVDAKLVKIKDEGNKRYGEKKFKEAIQKFSEGIDMYLKDQENFRKDKDVKIKITQMYTNRSLSHHQLNDQQKAFEDADHVLRFLDANNGKALFRRAIANKSFGKLEESLKDLQILFKQDQSKKDIKQELDECMKLFMEQQKQKKDQAQKDVSQPKSKIQEVSASEVIEKEVVIKEEAPEEKKAAAKKPQMTKNLDQETINKAVEITEKLNKQQYTIPKTAAGFESFYNSSKKDLPTFYQYLKRIPTEVLEQIFKNVEIQAEIFSAIMRVLCEHGLAEDIVSVSKQMVSLSKASNFDMTLMFMDSKEKKDLVHIIQEIKKSDQVDKEVIKRLDTIYKI